ncbi:MAG: GNAT family N-acetyltransferase [Chloroflexi bacterium]|nr:GNAT family N-acetyltransferase [Chloroflexota bacterium]
MEFVTNPTDHQLAEVEHGLNEYNAGVVSARSVTPVQAVFVESGRAVAGVVAAAYWGKLHVRLLWVHSDHQHEGLGTRLMRWAEDRGRDLHCVSIMVDTMSFQAPEFYAKLGYGQFGVSGGYEGGASRHYFEKTL